MTTPIAALSLDDFAALLDAWKPKRRITEIHIHCTDRPRHADWRGLPSVEAMRRVHQSLGMRDIAQHLTIAPDGILWTGRPLDMQPASVRGHNGNSDAGPFMIEMVGLFENGTDPFIDPQKQSVYESVVLVLRKSGLTEAAVKFHREFPGTGKTCPGLDLDPGVFRADIGDLLAGRTAIRSAVALPEGLGIDRATRDRLARAFEDDGEIGDPDDAQAEADQDSPEDADTLTLQTILARTMDATRSGTGRDLFARSATPEFRNLAGHVINTSQGVLSSQGLMHTSADDLDRLIDNHLLPAINANEVDHIVFYAHGGLVSERAALCYAGTMLPWWQSHRVYPIFFVWESNALQAIFEAPRAAARERGLDDWWDKGVEVATQRLSRELWTRIKANARRCSESMTRFGQPGGLFEFAHRLLARRRNFESRVRLHAVGHSTGPILLARFMPLLTDAGLKFTTLSYLAPALRIDDFTGEVAPAVQRQDIGRLTLYTMNRRAERDDDVVGLHRKSLLYYVRDACEDRTEGRILGLQEDLLDDTAMTAWFGLAGARPLSAANPAERTRIEFSQHPDQPLKNPKTTATRHGDFDNDKATMTAVLADIIAPVDPRLAGGRHFPAEADFRYCRALDAPSRTTLPQPAAGAGCGCCCRDCPCCSGTSAFDEGFDDAPVGPLPDTAGTTDEDAPAGLSGQRKAVCIGIDTYAKSPLEGCVNDARAWAGKLQAIGFSVLPLENGKATRAAMLESLRDLIDAARPGDELVWFYAGHGTQVDDLDGDEVDRYDEALVPIDFTGGHLLTDDDIHSACRGLGLKGNITLTIITDCCHSGTNTRARFSRQSVPAGSRNRYITLAPDVAAAYRLQRSRARAAPRRDEDDAPAGIVAIAACHDREVALETGGQGDFTRHALAAFDTSLQQGHSNRMFLREVIRRFGPDRRQNPQLQDPAQGLRKRRFLGGRG